MISYEAITQLAKTLWNGIARNTLCGAMNTVACATSLAPATTGSDGKEGGLARNHFSPEYSLRICVPVIR